MKWKRTSQRRCGFTLIELLVVIAIIATLAALVASLAAGAGRKKVRARATALIEEVTTAIEGYKDKMGFLPPDNPQKPDRPPLYYLLKGTTNLAGAFAPVEGQTLNSDDIDKVFGLKGFLNSVPVGQKPKDFYPGLKQSNVGTQKINGKDVKFIVMPYKGPDGDFNPVRYDASSQSRHNPESYDLWVEVMIGRETVIIGNWRQ